MLSNLRKLVLAELAKAWRLGLDVPASRLVTVFKLNGSLTYRFLRELEFEGVVERAGRGRWRLRDTTRARALAEYALELWTGECRERPATYLYLCEELPGVYYYMPNLPTTWFGGVEYVLVVADTVLKGRVEPPGGYRFVYTSLRGREFRFDYNTGVTVGEREQSVADYLSYDPYYPVEHYIAWHLGDIDLDLVAKKCTIQGLRRLSTFLSFARMATGKPVAASFNYLSLLNEDLYQRYVSEYFTWVFGNIAESRNI